MLGAHTQGSIQAGMPSGELGSLRQQIVREAERGGDTDWQRDDLLQEGWQEFLGMMFPIKWQWYQDQLTKPCLCSCPPTQSIPWSRVPALGPELLQRNPIPRPRTHPTGKNIKLCISANSLCKPDSLVGLTNSCANTKQVGTGSPKGGKGSCSRGHCLQRTPGCTRCLGTTLPTISLQVLPWSTPCTGTSHRFANICNTCRTPSS